MISTDLDFRIDWKPGLITTGGLSVWIEGHAVWPVGGDDEAELEVQTDDLLSHLVDFWNALMLRQTYPTEIMPLKPTYLRGDVERTWDEVPGEIAEEQDALLSAFEEAHDVSRCFAGMFGLPPLWLLRSGDRMLVDTRERLYEVPFASAERALVRVGDEIAERLVRSSPEKWSDLVEAWRSRDSADPVSLVAWSTGIKPVVARRLVDAKLIDAPANVSVAANDNDEVRIAARMAGALPTEEIEAILRLIRSFERRDAQELDRLSGEVTAYVTERFDARPAFDQGEAAARRLRELLGIDLREPVDVLAILKRLGVSVRSERTPSDTLKALAIWGSKHGPTILLNDAAIRDVRDRRMSTRAGQDRRFQNVTLAHELGHFVLDRGHAVGAVDVLVNRMPRQVESRAASFAGEFLLPATAAAEGWSEAHRPKKGLSDYLLNLESTYAVTRSVAAWKLEHGLKRRGIDVPVMLGQLAPRR